MMKIPKGKAEKVHTKRDSGGKGKINLVLFVTGILPNSVRAITNAKAICEKYLKGNYNLEIVDIYQKPSRAMIEGIIAVPVLIKKYPLPETRMIGDLSDTHTVLQALQLESKPIT